MPELATCPACGRQRNTSYTRCPNCGTPQGARPAPPPPLPDRAGLVERGVTSGPRPAPPAGAARDFAALAARAIATAAPLLTLDWHPASLLALDLFCDITWGEDGLSPNDPAWQPNAAQARVIEDSGAFLGEVVRRDGAGRWQDDADPRRAQVVFGDGQRALPLRQMHERLRRGAAASLRAWHVALRRARGVRPDAAELEGWLAQAERFRRVGRPDLALAFVREALALPLDAATRHQVERLATSLRQPPAPAVAPPAPVPPPLPATAPGLQQQPVPPKPAPPPATPPPLPRPPWVVAAQGDVVAGQELLRKGQPEAARAAFARALAVDPACGPALLGRAECCLLLGEAEAARAQLTPLGARSDCEPQRMLLLARCADALDDPVTAHTFWSRLQARADLDPPTRATATARTRALAEVPAVSLARALALAELDAAVQALAQVCAAHPEFAPAWRERGVGEQLLGHAEAALQCLDRAIGLAPDEVQGHDHKATTLARLNRLPEALATVAAGLERCPDAPQLRLRQGALLASAGQMEAALAVFTALAEAVPDHPNVWGNRADAESRLGRPQAAAASLRRFLAVNQERGHPRLAMAREQLWRLEHPDQRRDPEAAARHLKRAAAARTAAEALPALQAALTADPLAGNAWFGHGACLLQLERTDAALASLAQAEALLGPTEDVVALRASALLAAGQAEAALACYQRHLARGTPGPNARRGQVLVLTLLGRHADAAQILAELLATEPDDVTLRQAWDKATVAARQPPRA